MEVLLLGPLEVRSSGERLPLGGPRQRALLAHLALNVGSVVSMDTLLDDLWHGEPPPAAVRPRCHRRDPHGQRAPRLVPPVRPG